MVTMLPFLPLNGEISPSAVSVCPPSPCVHCVLLSSAASAASWLPCDYFLLCIHCSEACCFCICVVMQQVRLPSVCVLLQAPDAPLANQLPADVSVEAQVFGPLPRTGASQVKVLALAWLGPVTAIAAIWSRSPSHPYSQCNSAF